MFGPHDTSRVSVSDLSFSSEGELDTLLVFILSSLFKGILCFSFVQTRFLFVLHRQISAELQSSSQGSLGGVCDWS